MSSQKTTNYDLNQWLPDDSVLRTDFNADNAKIDAALSAMSQTHIGDISQLRSEFLWTKILDFTLNASASTVTLNVPAGGNYQALELYLSYAGPSAVTFSINSGESLYVTGSRDQHNNLTIYDNPNPNNYPLAVGAGYIRIYQCGTGLYGFYETVGYEQNYYCQGDSGSFITDTPNLSGVDKLVLNSTGNFAIGGRFILYGLK